MQSEVQNAPVSAAKLWTGRILSGLAVLFLVFDGIGKLLKPAPVIQGCTRLGYPLNTITGIGIALLACTVLYVIPRTSVVGAILLTGYLGGAVASNVRAEQPWLSNTLFPVYFAVIVWLGLFLRDRRVRVLISRQS